MKIDPIIAFFLNSKELKASLGFTARDVIEYFSNENLESCHNYIQWAFPLEEPSKFNLEAPLLTADTIAAFKDLPILGDQVHHMLHRMWKFYFQFNDKIGDWITPRNHNFLRITRILKFLRTVGYTREADFFWYWIENAVLANPIYAGIVGEETIKFWKEANETKPD